MTEAPQLEENAILDFDEPLSFLAHEFQEADKKS